MPAPTSLTIIGMSFCRKSFCLNLNNNLPRTSSALDLMLISLNSILKAPRAEHFEFKTHNLASICHLDDHQAVIAQGSATVLLLPTLDPKFVRSVAEKCIAPTTVAQARRISSSPYGSIASSPNSTQLGHVCLLTLEVIDAAPTIGYPTYKCSNFEYRSPKSCLRTTGSLAATASIKMCVLSLM